MFQNNQSLYIFVFYQSLCWDCEWDHAREKLVEVAYVSIFVSVLHKKRVWPSSLHEEECWRRTRCTVLTLFRMVWRNGVSPLPGQTVIHSLSIAIMLVSFPLYNQGVSFPIVFALCQPDVAAEEERCPGSPLKVPLNAPECNDTLKAIEVQDMADCY